MVLKNCASRTCFNSSHTRPDLMFFPFPKSEKFARAWAEACGSPELLNKTMNQLTRHFLCAEHFEDKCFTNLEKKNTLVRWNDVYSMPTKFQHSEHSEPEDSDANSGVYDTNPELKLLSIEGSNNKRMKICRLCSCLKFTDFLAPIYGSYYHSLMIKLRPFGICIERNDGLSALICRTCAAKLLLVVETLEQFYDSEQKLKLALLPDLSTINDQAKIVDPIVTNNDSNESSQNEIPPSESPSSQQNQQKEPDNENLERRSSLQVENVEVNEETSDTLVKMEVMDEENNTPEPDPIQTNSPIVKQELEIVDVPPTNAEISKETPCQQPVSIEFQYCETTSAEKEQMSTALENDPLSDEFQTHSCKHCRRFFTSKVFLTRHMLNEHKTVELIAENIIKSRTKEYKCTVCQAMVKSSLAYLSHLKMHAAKTPGLELSKLRTAAFPTTHKLNSSIPVEIVDRTDDQAEDQKKIPPRKIQKVSILKKNFQRLFKCDLCNLSFFKKNELLLHIQTHKSAGYEINTYINKPFRLEIENVAQVQNKGTKEINTAAEENKSHPQSDVFFVNIPIKNESEIPIIDLEEDSSSKNQIIQSPEEKEEQKGEENEDMNYSVELSENSEDSEFNLKAAIEMEQADREMFMCTQCSEVFATRGGVIKHIQKQHGNDPLIHFTLVKIDGTYECGICKIIFGTRKGFDTHLNTHMSSSLSLVNKVCDICGYNTRNENMFSFHMDSHMQRSYEENKLKKLQVFGINLKDLKCTVCKEQFNTNSMLVTHISSAHLVSCKHCNEEFQTQEKLNIHMREVHQESDFVIMQTYVCNICGEHFSNKESTYKHIITHKMKKINTIHAKLDKPFRCTICNTLLKTKYMMYCHMNKHKGVENAFACDSCNMRFDTDSIEDHFQKHEPKVDSDSQQGCTICGKSILKSSLKRHYLKVHCTVNTNRKRKFDCDG